jgi:hypothetical protein
MKLNRWSLRKRLPKLQNKALALAQHAKHDRQANNASKHLVVHSVGRCTDKRKHATHGNEKDVKEMKKTWH